MSNLSLHISSFSPNGHFLVASDTRMCRRKPDGKYLIVRDDISKTVQLDHNTFVFMSGNYEAARFILNEYIKIRTGNVEKDRFALTSLLRRLYNSVSAEEKERAKEENGGEIAVLYLIRCTEGQIVPELYMHEHLDYTPCVCIPNKKSVIVLGSYIPGTDTDIRRKISKADTHDAMVSAYRKIYNQQSRAEVGGTLEMFEISPEDGLVRKMAFKIEEDK